MLIKLFNRYKSILFIIGGFFLGASLSGGLLFYSGKELVNVFVYFAFVVLFPALLSIFGFISFIFLKKDSAKLLGLRLSLLGGVAFSLGALASLLITISTQDISFGWATTLNIDAKSLKSLIDKIAFWHGFCPDCTVSEKLIKLSRYSRLGGAVNKEQIQNALLLGQWWKFLAVSIFVYGVGLRALLYGLSFLFGKEAKIEFSSNKEAENFKQTQGSYKNIADAKELEGKEIKLLGYYFDTSSLNLQSSDDAKEIVVAVKSWEVPILDVFDYLQELKEENPGAKISILLAGLEGAPKESDVNIWLRKLKELNLNYKVYR